MKKNSRRAFITKMGVTVGALTLGRNLMQSSSLDKLILSDAQSVDKNMESLAGFYNFKYAPANWQSTYCFPDDPYKSLVGKMGELLYGHPGIGQDEKIFPHVVSVGLKGKEPLKYIEQKLESPSIPIITTKLGGGEVIVQLTSFATNNNEEGRVDNLLIEIQPKEAQSVQCTPEIIIKGTGIFVAKEEDDYVSIHFDAIDEKLFMVVDCPVEDQLIEGAHHYQLKAGTAKIGKPLRFFARFPQEGQLFEKISDGLEEPEDMLNQARTFWQSWKPTSGKVEWQLQPDYQNFAIASTRNILESREIKDGKKIFQVGPTVYRGQWVVDGHFMLEAARYLGYDKEAQEGLESIWNRQDEQGLITGGAGEAHWKDTAVAVYALIRQAELSQNWDYFDEIYPDANKALMYLKELKDKAENDGSSNGKYKILPKGFGDSGIGGIREEYTNTIWTLVALKALDEVGKRFQLLRKNYIRDWYGELRQNFYKSIQQEMRQHPNGFSYLPMLMKSDPKWSESDVRKQPRPQAAQIYVSHAIYPGLLCIPNDPLVTGHVELMKAVMKEDIPAETGWMPNDAVWTYNAACVAQVFLWLGMRDLARQTFIGFLNHASPLYAWREEQSLHDAANFQFIGDMPHNWASAECIRYLRHMMILEDEKNLKLFQGITLAELNAGKPMSLTYSPTRWGRISLSLEPVDKKTWHTKFKREDFDEKKYSKLDYIIMPRKMAGVFYFNGAKGVLATKNGEEVLVRTDNHIWECEWKSL